MDKETSRGIELFSELVRKKFPVLSIILYGSYAKGEERADSDIDIAVVVDSVVEGYLEDSARLFELIWDIDKRIEPVLILSGPDKSGFLESITKYGKIIYQAT